MSSQCSHKQNLEKAPPRVQTSPRALPITRVLVLVTTETSFFQFPHNSSFLFRSALQKPSSSPCWGGWRSGAEHPFLPRNSRAQPCTAHLLLLYHGHYDLLIRELALGLQVLLPGPARGRQGVALASPPGLAWGRRGKIGAKIGFGISYFAVF